jgi:hypothetical protein
MAERVLADMIRERETHGPTPTTSAKLTLDAWLRLGIGRRHFPTRAHWAWLHFPRRLPFADEVAEPRVLRARLGRLRGCACRPTADTTVNAASTSNILFMIPPSLSG